MKNFSLVQRTQASSDLNKAVPDLVLRENSLLLLVVANLLQEIAAGCVVHYYAEARGGFVEECLLVAHNVGISARAN